MTTATDRQALIEKANRVRKCVYLAAEESVADDISHTIGQLLEALSSSAPVETPAYAHGFAAGWKAAIARGQQALGDLGEGAIANAYAEALESSPTDPPIPSPGDEERKHEIAKLCEHVWMACWNYLTDADVAQWDEERRNQEIAKALSDYEIKAGGK